MNLESHVYISKLVYNETIKIFPIHINRKLFRAGNVLSDYSPLVWTHPHYFTVSWDFFERYVDHVCRLGTEEDAIEPDLVLSFQMGIICHYITDFFCRAHIGSGIGRKREHLQYEDFLDNYRNSIKGRLSKTDWLSDFEPCEETRDILSTLKANIEYYRDLPASPERDITMAIDNCVKVMVSIISIRLKQAVRHDLFQLHRHPQLNYELPNFSMNELFEVVMNKNYSPILAAIRIDLT